MPEHLLHKTICRAIGETSYPGYDTIWDYACMTGSEGDRLQRIPLFCKPEKSGSSGYCNVDMVVMRDKTVKVVLEIEESGIKPSKICGKLLTSALSEFYIHGEDPNERVRVTSPLLFVQVLRTPKPGSVESKMNQWKNLESSIRSRLPIGNVTDYHILYGSVEEFKDAKAESLKELIGSYLNGDCQGCQRLSREHH